MNRRSFFKMTFFSSMALPISVIWAEHIYDPFPYPRLWRKQSINKAIFELFGNINIIKNDSIGIDISKLCENGGSVPCRLYSTLDLKRVALFMEPSETEYSDSLGRKGLVAIWTIPKGQIMNYSFRIRISGDVKLKVVAETTNGDFFYNTAISYAQMGH